MIENYYGLRIPHVQHARKPKKALDAKGLEVETRNIVENTPANAELKKW